MIFITNEGINQVVVEIIVVHCIDIDIDIDVNVNVNVDSNNNESSSSSNSCNSSSSTVLFTDTLKRKLCLLEDDNSNNNKNNNKSNNPNITLRVIQYKDGGGRGPCLNYGALHSKGRILTFLHADTYLNKKGWNNAIINAFNGCCDDNNNNNNNDNNNKNPKTRIITCCAFSFAIEKSTIRTGIPGINAIEVTANIRTKLFKLPYGDQCISIPSIIFNYIGGYPDQCLIEDYELVCVYIYVIILYIIFCIVVYFRYIVYYVIVFYGAAGRRCAGFLSFPFRLNSFFVSVSPFLCFV
jgi:hypothetical protein